MLSWLYISTRIRWAPFVPALRSGAIVCSALSGLDGGRIGGRRRRARQGPEAIVRHEHLFEKPRTVTQIARLLHERGDVLGEAFPSEPTAIRVDEGVAAPYTRVEQPQLAQ